MARVKKILAPTYTELIVPTYKALLALGGSGTNSEIYEQVIKDMKLSDEVVDESHLGSENQTELEYQLAWARTYLKNYGVIINSARSVWSITPNYTLGIELDAKEIVAFIANKNAKRRAVSGKKAMQYCPLCEETRQKNLYAVHIVPSTVCIDPEQKKDKANGLLLCKEHARAYINQEFYFNSAGFVAESNNESIDCRMHLSFSILSKSRKKYLQAREAMMKKNVEF